VLRSAKEALSADAELLNEKLDVGIENTKIKGERYRAGNAKGDRETIAHRLLLGIIERTAQLRHAAPIAHKSVVACFTGE